jgi:SAM-dependent methyltransferase
LRQWEPLLRTWGVHFVNLQYGDVAAEVEAIERDLGVKLHDWDDADPTVDLEQFAAEVAALDLVISVSNTTVHTAGALGVPVWTLLSSVPNCRWLLGRDDALWYSSMRLLRQPKLGDWESVIARAAGDLAAIVEVRGAGRARNSVTVPADTAGEIDTSDMHEPECEADQPQPARAADSDDVERERRKYEQVWKHDDYRIYSPGLHDAEKVPLIATLRERGVKTILDAGCGTGKLMHKLMTEHGDEFAVHGFDISANCLDSAFDDVKDEILTVGCLWDPHDFDREYDAILCTDVLEHIPTEHVPAVLRNFRRCSRKLCYLAIALFPDGFGPKLVGEPLHLTVQPVEWWLAELAKVGFEVTGHAVERTADGRDLWLHAFLK